MRTDQNRRIILTGTSVANQHQHLYTQRTLKQARRALSVLELKQLRMKELDAEFRRQTKSLRLLMKQARTKFMGREP